MEKTYLDSYSAEGGDLQEIEDHAAEKIEIEAMDQPGPAFDKEFWPREDQGKMNQGDHAAGARKDTHDQEAEESRRQGDIPC